MSDEKKTEADALDSESTAEPEAFFNADYEALAERARASGMTFTQYEWGRKPKYWYTDAVVHFPRGDGSHPVRFLRHYVPRVLAFDFENYRFSRKYEAVFHIETGRIEVGLTWAQAFNPRPEGMSFWDLPGIEIDEQSPLRTGTAVDEWEIPDGWRMVVRDDDIELEISPASQPYLLLMGRNSRESDVTLKVVHKAGKDGPRADDLLDGPAEDFMMDLELRYQLGSTLVRFQTRTKARSWSGGSASLLPEYPRLEFEKEASAFYWYGSSAREFPMLQFLAFYQVLEFFFSSFTRSAAIGRIRSQIKDPGFDLSQDRAVERVIEASRVVHAGLKRENEQLAQTVLECLEEEELRAFIRADPARLAHFIGGKQKIRGVKPLRLDGENDDLRLQVAERVYRVRNRIVHTKSAAEEFGLDLLLPTSDETPNLGAEVELARWIAQRALIHGARLRERRQPRT